MNARRDSFFWAAVTSAIWCTLASASFAQVDIIALPEILLAGERVYAHTQGLYVTDQHYLVTGRLETTPKRAMLFRFLREDPNQYEVVDITPVDPAFSLTDGSTSSNLDHPGGFDRDQQGVYWIPISTSHRRGPTVILGVAIDPNRPLDELAFHVSMHLPDHLGALCCVEDDLLAANWDTKTIYRLAKKDGKVRREVDRSKFVARDPTWFLAVQDWKYDLDSKQVIAGGIDKSTHRGDQAQAVISWINLRTKTERSRRLSPMPDVSRPLTNEGMAWFGDDLFLLPEDLGRGAKILRFPNAKANP